MYSCTCVDYAVYFVACKLVHLVRMQVSNDSDEEFLTVLTELYNENITTAVTESAVGGDSMSTASLSPITLENEDHHTTTEQDAIPNEESHLEYYSRILQSTNKGTKQGAISTKVAEMQNLMGSCPDMNIVFFCDITLVICN